MPPTPKTRSSRFSLTKSFLVVAVLTGCSCLLTLQALGQSTYAAGLIDKTPNIVELDASIEKGRGPDALDARKPYIRFRGKGSKARIQLACHPEQQNYLTVKVWGGSGSPGSKLTLKSAGLLLHQRTAEPFPGRFYYATQPIPRKRTDGKSTVTVTLQSKGGKPGPDVYNIYTHVGAFFQPPAGELQGKPFKLGPPRPDEESGDGPSAEEAFTSWKKKANKLIEDALGYQIYGDGPEPEWTHGAINAWGGSPDGAYKKRNSDLESWGGGGT